MTGHPTHQPAESFFLKAGEGERYCIYYPPNLDKECLGRVIYVPPFAEEMNKSRRMIALQSRVLADMGYAVLQLDLFGCGDSSGDFADARWNIWIEDLAIAEKWLADKVAVPLSLWGLRLGAHLALDFAGKTSCQIDKVILWQPIIDTAHYLTQFLRLRLVNEILGAGTKTNSPIAQLRNSLAMGNSIEIAGYELAPALANAINAINIATLAVTKCTVHWFEIMPESRPTLTPAAQGCTNSMMQQGSDLKLHFVTGAAFWSTQEITECPALLLEMAQVFCASTS